ncbi:MAG: glycosyltransferase family A protein [Pseudomonadota bacterium]
MIGKPAPTDPLVSTIVPVYKGIQTISATVDSLLAQTYERHEVILVDDGSPDDSFAVVQDLARENDAVIAVRKRNGGVGDARNFGVKHANGGLIAFCDQDDLWEPDKLELQVPLFNDRKVGLVFSGVKTVYPEREVVGLPRKARPTLEDLLEQNRISCCTAVVRRKLFDEVGGFSPERTMAGVDDWHLWVRILQHSKSNSVPKALATHIIHGENYSLNESAMLEAAIFCLSKLAESRQKPAIKSSLLRHARRRVYEHYAQNLLHNGDFSAAADCHFKAWQQNPVLLSHLGKGTLLRVLPGSILDSIQRQKRSLASRSAAGE